MTMRTAATMNHAQVHTAGEVRCFERGSEGARLSGHAGRQAMADGLQLDARIKGVEWGGSSMQACKP